MAAENPIVECCICGNGLKYNDAILISLCQPDNISEAQGLFAHYDCLNKILHKDVPRLLENLANLK